MRLNRKFHSLGYGLDGSQSSARERSDPMSACPRDLMLNSFLPPALVLFKELNVPLVAWFKQLIVLRVIRCQRICLGSCLGIIRTDLARSIPCA